MMKHTSLAVVLLTALASITLAQDGGNSILSPSALPKGRTEAEKRILAVLGGMVRSHQTYLSVPIPDGMALRLLTEAVNAQRAVEIGTSTGYSGLWFCLALQSTGGHLTTFEINHARASMARQHFREAGVASKVTIVEGDAHEKISTLQGPIDVAFIDADKSGYVDYLRKLLPLVRPGGLILAHNVDMVPDYVRQVTTNPELETIFYMQGRGLAVSLKKRN
jgi:caffeoyl-CoA O-methyltransferase